MAEDTTPAATDVFITYQEPQQGSQASYEWYDAYLPWLYVPLEVRYDKSFSPFDATCTVTIETISGVTPTSPNPDCFVYPDMGIAIAESWEGLKATDYNGRYRVTLSTSQSGYSIQDAIFYIEFGEN